jgi:SAM-dependent methyltransferase
MDEKAKENWGTAAPYESYVGRWSRKVASEFLCWISVPAGATWADIGCGTGVLADCILAQCEPKSIAGVDKAEGFISAARQNIKDPRVTLDTADATALPWQNDSFDVTVAGLLLNFVPGYKAVTSEMTRVTNPGGKVAAYVWDYSGGMEMMRHFWDVVVELNPNDSALDQGERFPLCQPDPLAALFRESGLTLVSVRPIDVPTVFRDFNDYWMPFLGKQGAAPTYLASLDKEMRDRIRGALRARLTPNADGSITLTARAWAVQGTVPRELAEEHI